MCTYDRDSLLRVGCADWHLRTQIPSYRRDQTTVRGREQTADRFARNLLHTTLGVTQRTVMTRPTWDAIAPLPDT